jgi:hypothetical protein
MAVLSLGIVLVVVTSLFVALVLDTASRGRREAKLLRYLAEPWPPSHEEKEAERMRQSHAFY